MRRFRGRTSSVRGYATSTGSTVPVLLCIVALVLAWTLARGRPAIEDEVFHVQMIDRILAGYLALDTPMIPGFHFVMAGLAGLAGSAQLDVLRAFSALFGALSVLTAWAVAKRLDPATAGIRVLQYAFLPFLFPHLALVYTESLSFLLVLLSLLGWLRGRLLWSGIAITAAVLVRQTNVVWAGLLFGLTALDSARQVPPSRLWFEASRRAWTYLPALAVFAGFVLHNRGLVPARTLAAKVKILTGEVPFHIENILFSALIAVVLFLPLVLSSASDRLRTVARGWAWLFPGAVLLGFLLFFRVDHPWNHEQWYLPNRVLALARDGLLSKLAFFVPVAVGLLWFRGMRFERPEFRLLYLFWAIALIPLWLISPRYELPGLVLLVLLRRPESRTAEIATVAWEMILSGIFLYGLYTERFGI